MKLSLVLAAAASAAAGVAALEETGTTLAPPPPATKKPETARWMVANLEWGSLSTISSRSEGVQLHDPFGNPYAFADVGGQPYLYASGWDASMIDVAAGEKRVSLALSEATLMKDGSAQLRACQIGVGFGDPENPPCARLVLSGSLSKVNASSDEEHAAKTALFARHPSFRFFPSSHEFYVAKLNLDGIWLVGMYGGAAIISNKDYFAASPKVEESLLAASAPKSSQAATVTAVDPPPSPSDSVGTAKWMMKTMTYGFLATISTRSEGSSKGDPFGNPYSFAEVGGVPYFYGSQLDASMIDLFGGNSSSTRATLAVSEASFPGPTMKSCEIGRGFGDPENPPCARLVLSGVMSKPTGNEEMSAKAALFVKHPSFADFPAGHDFFVLKMNIDGIWLISHYGGPAIVNVEDYLRGWGPTVVV